MRALSDFSIPETSGCVLFSLDPSDCYGSTTMNEEDGGGDNNEPLLLKSALDGAYKRMRLQGALPSHINVTSLHRLLMSGSGVPPPYHRFGWSTGSSRRYHHRRHRRRRRCWRRRRSCHWRRPRQPRGDPTPRYWHFCNSYRIPAGLYRASLIWADSARRISRIRW